jgi:hypothetical protein
MKSNLIAFAKRLAVILFAINLLASSPVLAATNYTIVGWNNLGMHCMDSDYSVFSILPPYNTIHAQAIVSTSNTLAKLIVSTNSDYSVTYQAVGDYAGSTNSTSQGKGNYWDYLPYGAVAVNQGLPVPTNSFWMPANGTAQAMLYEFTEANFGSTSRWYAAYGIPITPYDDAGMPNQYPMMRLTLKNGGGTTLKTTDIVLPVSDEMDCKLCHLSGSGPAARPAAGWVNDPNPARDYRLNILRLHDERQWASNATLYAAALASNSFNAAGLYANVTINGKPIVCAMCHKSEALPIPPLLGIPQLTTSIHKHHAGVIDPRNNQTLDAANNRMACYTCHPGSVTRCLRGAMGKAVAADGAMEMQCQSCHGTMSLVGGNRTGWVSEPTCEACHSGDAVSNSGQIRFTDAFDSPGHWRVPTNRRFAVNLNTPATGASLYRFSKGHGNLQCEACHGSTHAEYPSAYANDNKQSLTLQTHAGVISLCSACHYGTPNTSNGGPHGLHQIGSSWRTRHTTPAHTPANCRPCHGTDDTGTVLSRSLSDQVMNDDPGNPVQLWQGRRIGCYDCHNGAGGPDDGAPRPEPGAATTPVSTDANVPVNLTLTGSGAVSWRIVSQPANGTVGISGSTATYYPSVFANPGVVVTDKFTFASFSGYRESRLATGTVYVTVLDTVSDGLPDWWRASNFGGDGKSTNNLSCATCDPDGDGMNDYQEFVAGTDPNDSRSTLRIFAFSLGGGNAALSFASLLANHYAVDYRNSLTAGSWTTLNSNVWGWTDTTTFADTNAAVQATRFYRVRALMP